MSLLKLFKKKWDLGQRRMMEGVNLPKIYCNHFCKSHKVPFVTTES